MPTTADYLNGLIAQKGNLVDVLNEKGVEANENEKLNTLVPKVGELPIKPPKGFVITEWTNNGYPKIVEIYGMSTIPKAYFASTQTSTTGYYREGVWKGLTKIVFHEDIEAIEMYAFTNAGEVVSFVFPNNIVPKTVKSIGAYAFQRFDLDSLTFEGTPDAIADSAFYSASKLKVINVPWSEGEVANAPWGATSATINYNYTEE